MSVPTGDRFPISRMRGKRLITEPHQRSVILRSVIIKLFYFRLVVIIILFLTHTEISYWIKWHTVKNQNSKKIPEVFFCLCLCHMLCKCIVLCIRALLVLFPCRNWSYRDIHSPGCSLQTRNKRRQNKHCRVCQHYEGGPYEHDTERGKFSHVAIIYIFWLSIHNRKIWKFRKNFKKKIKICTFLTMNYLPHGKNWKLNNMYPFTEPI